MITIESTMLVALGFLLATLIAVLLAPAYRARAMRLTYKHMRRVMPLTESELLLDRDRLRAHYAVRIHELETKLEKLRLAAARQQVEVNRRDATISALESELARLRAELEENVNARRVLEQTVMDRLPAVEQRLAETRKLLEQRDRELATITADTSKNARALDEVMQINAQQRAEIERLNAVIATRGLRTGRGVRDPRFENELALRSELEALRAKTREQESLISRLQTLVTMPAQAARSNGGGTSPEQEAELDRLRRDLVEAESALKSIADQADGMEVADETMRARLQSLENLVADQAAKIKRLEAALAVYEKGEGDARAISLKDSKIAMKARIASLQAEADERAATIEKLRAELAAANERLALQAARFRDEVRRLRAGPAAAAPQKDEPKAAARRSLAQRITDVNPALAASLRAGSYGTIRRKVAAEPADEQAPVNDDREKAPPQQMNGPSADGSAAAKADGKENGKAPEAEAAAELDAATSESDAQPKPRLLDRLASISKQ